MNITFDLETLGTNHNAPIVQIGVVLFNDKGKINNEMQWTINTESLKGYGFEIDYPTVMWWLSQPKKAQKSVFGVKHKTPLAEALIEFKDWMLYAVAEFPDLKIWSHKDFDPVILQNAYKAVDIDTPPWYRRHVDIRTLTHLVGPITVERDGIHHNALDDCKYQAKYISAGLKILKRGGKKC